MVLSRCCLIQNYEFILETNYIFMTILFSGSFTEPSIKSQRISVAGELLNTEVNYVRILKTLCHKYKSGLEDETQCKLST